MLRCFLGPRLACQSAVRSSDADRLGDRRQRQPAHRLAAQRDHPHEEERQEPENSLEDSNGKPGAGAPLADARLDHRSSEHGEWSARGRDCQRHLRQPLCLRRRVRHDLVAEALDLRAATGVGPSDGQHESRPGPPRLSSAWWKQRYTCHRSRRRPGAKACVLCDGRWDAPHHQRSRRNRPACLLTCSTSARAGRSTSSATCS